MRQLIINGDEINSIRHLVIFILQSDFPVVIPSKLRGNLLGHVDETGATEARVHERGEHLLGKEKKNIVIVRFKRDPWGKKELQLTSNQLGTLATSWNNGQRFFVY